MKLAPIIINVVIVIGYNIVTQAMYKTGENSTQRIVVSGILAIVVYEVANYIYKLYKNNKADNRQ